MDGVFIGRKLKARRIALQISQKKLFELTGIYQPVLSQIEQGKICSQEDAEKIANSLNCAVSDLCEDQISANGVTSVEVESARFGDLQTGGMADHPQVDVPIFHSRVGVEYQRTVGDMTSERWDRVRVYMETPCDPALMDGIKGSLIDNAVLTVEETLKKIAIRSGQEPLDLKIK